MDFELLHPRSQLVEIMQRVYRNGMTTLSGGNQSIRDENGDIWITPAAVDKGKLSEDDIVNVAHDGVATGVHDPSSELPFHRAIYRQRPDLKAIVHAHPPALVSFSILRELPDTRIIPQANKICGPIGFAPYALTGSAQLGDNIAATFAEGHHIIILENHGAVAAGATLLEAFLRLETLEFCARTLIRAQAMGDVNVLSGGDLALFEQRQIELPTFEPAVHSSRERELRQELADIASRAYERQLMIGTQGVVSARLTEGSFLITPTAVDRCTITIEDIVLVRDGECEDGKVPSRSIKLHEAIYTKHPDIGCVITAQCPNVMAFAITGADFDTRTIPESYVLLRHIQRIPFRTLYAYPEEVADTMSLNRPVALVDNDCLLVVGSNVLKAFDRLEVAEFSARSLIDSAVLGRHVPIGEAAIRELELAFNLS